MMDYTTFRRKPEVSEYEVKLKLLEQNLKGLSTQIEGEEQATKKQRSLSREMSSQDPVTRRLMKLEERLARQEQRQDDYENRVKKVVERMCSEFDANPWQGAVENLRVSVDAKILLIEDRLLFFQNEIESRVEKECKHVHDKLGESLKRFTPKAQPNNEEAFNQLFEMIKKCIDSQQQMVDEFKQFKSSIKHQIQETRDGTFVPKSATFTNEQENRSPMSQVRVYSTGKLPPNTTVKKDVYRQPLKTQEGESERDYVNTNESSRSKSRKSYNELKEQDFDQMRRASFKEENHDIHQQSWYRGPTTDKNRYALAKQQIDNEINYRLMREENERKQQIEKDKVMLKKSSDRDRLQRSRSKHKTSLMM